MVKVYLSGTSSIRVTGASCNVNESPFDGWVKKYREECDKTSGEAEDASLSEIRKLKMKLAEQEKEIDFLKKAAAFFAKELG